MDKEQNHNDFKKFLNQLKEYYSSNEKVKSTELDWFHVGNEIILTLNSNVHTTIGCHKEYKNSFCIVYYQLGFSGLGTKRIKLDNFTYDKIKKQIDIFLTNH